MTITPDLPSVLLSSVITLLGKVPEGLLVGTRTRGYSVKFTGEERA